MPILSLAYIYMRRMQINMCPIFPPLQASIFFTFDPTLPHVCLRPVGHNVKKQRDIRLREYFINKK